MTIIILLIEIPHKIIRPIKNPKSNALPFISIIKNGNESVTGIDISIVNDLVKFSKTAVRKSKRVIMHIINDLISFV